MKVYDELGNPWKVNGGDPASRFVNRLTRSRYDIIVLPLKTLATGTLSEPVSEPEAAIHRQRLADCLDLLRSA